MKRNIIIGTLILGVLAAALWFAGKSYARYRIGKQISIMVSQTAIIESLEYESMDIGVFGDWLCLENVTLKVDRLDDAIQIKKVQIPQYRFLENEVSQAKILLNSIRLPISSIFAAASIPDMESKPFQTDLELSHAGCLYEYNPNTRMLGLKNLEIKAADSAEIRATFLIGNINPSAIDFNNPLYMLPQLLKISIHEADIIYHDHSFLHDKMQLWTADPGSSSAVFVKTLKDNVTRLQMMEKDDHAKLVWKRLGEFLADPQKLHLTLSPTNPVALARFLWIQQPGDVIKLLGVKVGL